MRKEDKRRAEGKVNEGGLCVYVGEGCVWLVGSMGVRVLTEQRGGSAERDGGGVAAAPPAGERSAAESATPRGGQQRGGAGPRACRAQAEREPHAPHVHAELVAHRPAHTIHTTLTHLLILSTLIRSLDHLESVFSMTESILMIYSRFYQ